MDGSNPYVGMVRKAFEEGATSAAGRMGSQHLLRDIGTNPHLVRALDAVRDATTPDEAAESLSNLADAIQDEAEAARGMARWPDIALAMGWTRTAAAQVWHADRTPAP